MAAKIRSSQGRNIETAWILKFLDLGAKRNTRRAFSGSLRPDASGMQSYFNFCTCWRFGPDITALAGQARWAGIPDYFIIWNSPELGLFGKSCENRAFRTRPRLFLGNSDLRATARGPPGAPLPGFALGGPSAVFPGAGYQGRSCAERDPSPVTTDTILPRGAFSTQADHLRSIWRTP